MKFPVKKVFVTQEWGVNPDVYARFGLKGHNGVDFRLFDEDGNKATTAKIYSPHNGKVIEAGYDANGYGNYLKIENSKEGSLLGHLKEFNVGVGDNIAEGNLVGIADNTGFSSGAHLHWGYYPIPRFKDNGFSGTINQLPLMAEEISTPEKQKLIDAGLITRPDRPYSDDELNYLLSNHVGNVEAGRSTLTGDSNARDYWLNKWGVPKEVVKEVEVIKEVPVEVVKEVFVKPDFKSRISNSLYSLALAFEGK